MGKFFGLLEESMQFLLGLAVLWNLMGATFFLCAWFVMLAIAGVDGIFFMPRQALLLGGVTFLFLWPLVFIVSLGLSLSTLIEFFQRRKRGIWIGFSKMYIKLFFAFVLLYIGAVYIASEYSLVNNVITSTEIHIFIAVIFAALLILLCYKITKKRDVVQEYGFNKNDRITSIFLGVGAFLLVSILLIGHFQLKVPNPGIGTLIKQKNFVLYGLKDIDTYRWSSPLFIAGDGSVRGSFEKVGVDTLPTFTLIQSDNDGKDLSSMLEKYQNVVYVESIIYGEKVYGYLYETDEGKYKGVFVWKTDRGTILKLNAPVKDMTSWQDVINNVMDHINAVEE